MNANKLVRLTAIVCALWAICLLSGPLAKNANGQDATKKPSETESAQQEEKGEEEDIPEPEIVQITTKDGIILKCLWFPGTEGKQSIPVILLHDWNGERDDMAEIASTLQKEFGCAALVPDLRGHGESIRVEGSDNTLDRERWKPEQIASIIADIEACKIFLVKKNNEGALNIDLLSVVAEGTTCIHAIQWTINDWQYGYVAGVKQGKDVKSLALIAPEKTYRGLSLTRNIKHPLFTGPADSCLSVLVLGNADDGREAIRESQSIYETMERLRKGKPAGANDERDEEEEIKYIYWGEIETRQQVRIVDIMYKGRRGRFPLKQVVSYFIKGATERFAEDHRWQDRSRD